MAGVSTDDMTPIYYALKAGLYQKADRSEIVAVSSGSVATAAVIAGIRDGEGESGCRNARALARLPVTIVANGAIFRPAIQSAAVAPLDSPIKNAADCNGKIACSAGLNDIHQP